MLRSQQLTKYRHWYLKIISQAKKEQQAGLRQKLPKSNPNYVYYEAHHIFPRSLFPLWINRKENIVLLTLREHFFCHRLLAHIYDGEKMVFAVAKMFYAKKYKDIVKKLSEEEIKNIKSKYSYYLKEFNQRIGFIKRIPVICLNTMKVYPSLSDVKKDPNLERTKNFKKCCQHQRLFAGYLKATKEKLIWEFYSPERLDYQLTFFQRKLELQQFELKLQEKKKLKQNKNKFHKAAGSKLTVCLETNQLFASTVEAGKKYHINQSSVAKSARFRRTTKKGLSFRYLSSQTTGPFDLCAMQLIPISNRVLNRN